MKYLIAGSSGQLAKAFLQRLEKDGADFLAPAEADFDITSEASIEKAVSGYKPDVLINCAAYNLVDKAETDRDTAFAVNVTGPRLLSAAANAHGARFVHYGTDYVFDGAKMDGLYTEADQTNPLGVYGQSKLEGEQAALDGNTGALVLRLSWVYGDGAQNFVHKLMGWAADRDVLQVVCDEFSVPTLTHTVVDVTMKALDEGLKGMYHLTNSGYCSRYEWAQAVFAIKGMDKFVRPVLMSAFDLPAKRPGFSAMDNAALKKAAGVEIPHWRNALEGFLKDK